MKASELREKLFQLQRDHGDLDVVDANDDPIEVEFNSDGDPAFVIDLDT